MPGEAIDQQLLPEPYKSLKIQPAKFIFECFTNSNKKKLKQLIADFQVNTIVDVDSGEGGAACYMAQLLPQNGKLYATGMWMENKLQLQNTINYNQFLSNIISQSVALKVVPIRLDSLSTSNNCNSPGRDVKKSV